MKKYVYFISFVYEDYNGCHFGNCNFIFPRPISDAKDFDGLIQKIKEKFNNPYSCTILNYILMREDF